MASEACLDSINPGEPSLGGPAKGSGLGGPLIPTRLGCGLKFPSAGLTARFETHRGASPHSYTPRGPGSDFQPRQTEPATGERVSLCSSCPGPKRSVAGRGKPWASGEEAAPLLPRPARSPCPSKPAARGSSAGAGSPQPPGGVGRPDGALPRLPLGVCSFTW